MAHLDEILWQPSDHLLTSSHMAKFQTYLASRTCREFSGYEGMHQYSVENTEEFWQAVADFCGIIWQTKPIQSYQPPQPFGSAKMLGAKWFEGGTLNFAENLLLQSKPGKTAITAYAEGTPTRKYSQEELRILAGRCAAALKKSGVKKGDRVAGVVSNIPEAIVAMLGTTALGAVWASCSPDFGAKGILDRLGQIDPQVVFFTDAYQYGGKTYSTKSVIAECLEKLPSTLAVSIDHLDSGENPASGVVAYNDFLDIAPLFFYEPCSFDDPLYIMFSSGTTGVPKCIVHGVGGTLIQHKKELLLHSNLGSGSKLLYFTTCGWMMWNWMVSALSTQTELILFEGSPAYPDLNVLWDLVHKEKITALGTSPKFISSCMNAGIALDLQAMASLQTILSTGAPLMPEHFDWVYKNCGQVHLASICGGTDIISCFMLGVPTLPVRRGEIQYAGLGMAVQSWDDNNQPVIGQKGELVCVKPFPSMPVKFWNDDEDKKYRKAYFNHYSSDAQEVWRHGDYIEITPSGGIIVYGRSDATLNPGGVRIGTAEIYRQVEKIAGIVDSIAVGRQVKGDTEIILFVKMNEGNKLDSEKISEIKSTIRKTLTPRHVPQEIIAVTDIPYTRSGKKVELAVTQAVHGEEIKNLDALANPMAMDQYFELGEALNGRS